MYVSGWKPRMFTRIMFQTTRKSHIHQTEGKVLHFKLLLFVAISTFIVLSLLVFFTEPRGQIHLLGGAFPFLYLFFPLFTLFIFSLSSCLLKSYKHGIIIALFFTIYSIFRFNNLTHPFFLILLFALFFTIDLLFSYRKE